MFTLRSDAVNKCLRRSKRHRSTSNLSDDDEEDHDLANCLVLLSNSATAAGDHSKHGDVRAQIVNNGKPGPAFQCKACKKVFTSHQALGGHRASHKKVKGCFASQEEEEEDYNEEEEEDDEEEEEEEEKSMAQTAKKRPSNVHECTICHRVFASGQALGGHKRCHWLTPSNSLRTSSFHVDTAGAPPVNKCEPSSDRLSLDLNLACANYSVDMMRKGGDGHGGATSSSWLQLSSGHWF